MKQEVEIWKDIKGYEGKYQISNLGRLKNIKSNRLYISKTYGNKIYVNISLTSNGVTKTFLWHRVVAIAFIPNPQNKPCINHIDNNPANNGVENLEWVTHKENTAHAVKQNRMKPCIGETNATTNLKNVQVVRIKKLLSAKKLTHQKIADRFSVSREVITCINRGVSWKHI